MSAIVKRCSVAAVLAIAVLLPSFGELQTSEAGLRLIADLEGCRLSLYQCSAGVWTQGIGHTAGVIPDQAIDERQAAVDLVDDVRRTERGMAACLPKTLPQETYDAVIAFAFNVGISAACHSTLVTLLQQRQWQQACDQLPRWVYVNGKKTRGWNSDAPRNAHCACKALPHHDGLARLSDDATTISLNLFKGGSYDALSTMRSRGPHSLQSLSERVDQRALPSMPQHQLQLHVRHARIRCTGDRQARR